MILYITVNEYIIIVILRLLFSLLFFQFLTDDVDNGPKQAKEGKVRFVSTSQPTNQPTNQLL
jgi:hypothetical protein